MPRCCRGDDLATSIRSAERLVKHEPSSAKATPPCPRLPLTDSRALRTDPVKQLKEDGVGGSEPLEIGRRSLCTPCFNKAPTEDRGAAAIAAGRHLFAANLATQLVV
jgi:hypothetical protein